MCIPKIPLPANVGTDAEMHEQPGLLGRLNEPDQIVPPFEVVLHQARKLPLEFHISYNSSSH